MEMCAYMLKNVVTGD